jgi:lipopolysaccharide transport system permease protein
MIIIFILTYGISLFTSIILVRLRDLEHITSLFMQLLFYATPIFYPASLLSLKLQKVLALNPLTVIIQSAREAYIYGRVINIRELGLLFLTSLIILFIGNIYFKKQVKKVAEYF